MKPVVYYEYLHLRRDGLPGRKRNFEAYAEWRKRKEGEEQVAAWIARVRSNPEVYKPSASAPEVQEWLQVLKATD